MKQRKIYTITLLCIGALSIYPLKMGISVLRDYFTQGGVDVGNYPQYIIPYTPICISLLIVTIFMPVIIRLFKKYSLLISSVISVLFFFIFELLFEKVTVFDISAGTPYETNVEYWQMASCVAYDKAPDISVSYPILANYSPAFKIHFYVISIVLTLATIHLITEFYRIYTNGDTSRKRPFLIQLIVTILFIALCILACFTAFFRTGTIQISTLSAFLMTLFFVVMGLTVGVYLGCIFYKKDKFRALILPSISASVVTLIMYIGELILLDGALYIFGNSFIFQPIMGIPFAMFDLLVILFSGLCSYIILKKTLYSHKK